MLVSVNFQKCLVLICYLPYDQVFFNVTVYEKRLSQSTYLARAFYLNFKKNFIKPSNFKWFFAHKSSRVGFRFRKYKKCVGKCFSRNRNIGAFGVVVEIVPILMPSKINCYKVWLKITILRNLI